MGGFGQQCGLSDAPLFPLYEANAAAKPGRAEYGVMALVMAVAVAERFYVLDVPALNLDEALVAVASVHDAAYIFLRSLQTDAHPPFFYYLVKLLLFLGKSDFALRLAPCLCGAGTIYALYALGRRWFGASTALLAAGLLSVNLLHVQVSRSLRPHAIVVFLATLSFFYFLEYLRAPTRRWLVKAALVNAAMLLLHFNALLAVASQGLFYLILMGLRRKRPDRAFWFWTGLAVAGAAPGAAFLLCRIGQFSGFNLNESMLWTIVRTYDNLAVMFAFFPGWVFALCGTAFFATGLAAVFLRDRLLALAGLTAFAAPLLALIAAKYGIFYSPWHIAFLLPVMALFAAYALTRLLRKQAVCLAAAAATAVAGGAFLFAVRADSLYVMNAGLITPPPSKALARLVPETDAGTQFIFQKTYLSVFANWYLRLFSQRDLTRNAILPDERKVRAVLVTPGGLFNEFDKGPGIETIRQNLLSSFGPRAGLLTDGALSLPVWELDRTAGVEGIPLVSLPYKRKLTVYPSSFYREVRSLRDVMVSLSPLDSFAYPAGFDRPGRIEYGFVNRATPLPVNIKATAKFVNYKPGNEAVFSLRFDDEPPVRGRRVFAQEKEASLSFPIKRSRPFARLVVTVEMTATSQSPTFYSDSATIGFVSLDLEAYQEPEPFRSDPFVEKKGLSPLERSEGKSFVWAYGPESELRFAAERSGPMRLELEFYNPIPGQSVDVIINGQLAKTFANLPAQPWLKGFTSETIPFTGNQGENVVVLRYGRWNANPADPGGTFAPADGRPIAVAFTRLRARNGAADGN